MSNKGFYTETNFQLMQEEIRKLKGENRRISDRYGSGEYYYDSRTGWHPLPTTHQIHSSGSASADCIATYTRSCFSCDIATTVER